LALLLAAAPAVSLAADKIGFANRTLNGAFFNALTVYMKTDAEEAGFKFATTDAKGDLSKQIADVEDLLSQGIKYLVLNPQDPVAGVRIAKIAQRAGVPVIIIDSGIAPGAPVVTQIQTDNYANGRLIGDYTVSQFGDKLINAVLISGNQGNLVGEDRRTGWMVGVIEAVGSENSVVGKVVDLPVGLVTLGHHVWRQFCRAAESGNRIPIAQ
jgi:ribose transport system substrate-binding protein